MLAGLRFDAFIRRNHQHDEIDAPHACQHVANKTLMAGHVDKAEAQLFSVGSGQFEMGKSYIDRDAAALFFFQAIGINPGQSLHERSFAVIDMASGAYDDRFHAKTV